MQRCDQLLCRLHLSCGTSHLLRRDRRFSVPHSYLLLHSADNLPLPGIEGSPQARTRLLPKLALPIQEIQAKHHIVHPQLFGGILIPQPHLGSMSFGKRQGQRPHLHTGSLLGGWVGPGSDPGETKSRPGRTQRAPQPIPKLCTMHGRGSCTRSTRARLGPLGFPRPQLCWASPSRGLPLPSRPLPFPFFFSWTAASSAPPRGSPRPRA